MAVVLKIKLLNFLRKNKSVIPISAIYNGGAWKCVVTSFAIDNLSRNHNSSHAKCHLSSSNLCHPRPLEKSKGVRSQKVSAFCASVFKVLNSWEQQGSGFNRPTARTYWEINSRAGVPDIRHTSGTAMLRP